MPRKGANPDVRVAIVSNNPETLDGLQHYLLAAGVPCRSFRSLADADLPSARSAVLILFPDDLPIDAVPGFLDRLREAQPDTLTLLVTSTPARFRDVAPSDRRLRKVLLLAKPVFGWTILETIRAHASGGDLP